MSEKQFVVKELNFEDAVIEDTVTKEQYNEYGVVELLNEQQEQLDLYKEAILTMLGLLADKGIIFSGVKDE